MTQMLEVEGFRLIGGYFSPAEQARLVGDIEAIVAEAPLYRIEMPKSGALMSVRSTNAGELGWYSDKARGYRYEPCHPQTGKAWPPIPALAMEAWSALAGYEAPPEACLVNYYDAQARMGLHRDFDEADLSAPVISVSLGDTALFRLGGPERKGKTMSVTLRSGDVVVLGGAARLFFHGVDRIYGGSSVLLPQGGRYNLTLRRVTTPNKQETPCA